MSVAYTVSRLWTFHVCAYNTGMKLELDTPQRLCHLPLVMDVLRRTGINDIIDHAIQDDTRSKVSTSECLAVLLCGVFLGHHDLWRLADRLSPYDMATIMRDPGFNLAEFTEERMAKMLDDIYTANPEKLMTGISLQAIEQFNLGIEFFHFDTTSLSFYGAHENEGFESMADGSAPPPLVTYGYSKDHRPDLKQIIFGSLVTRDGGVPLYGKALDGNRSDSESAAEFFLKIRSIVRDPREVCCVADSKGWCAPVLALAQHERLRILSRLPRNHRLHHDIMDRPLNGQIRVERPSKNGKDNGDYYLMDGFDVDEQLYITETDNAKSRRLLVIPARAVRVFSSALMRQKQSTLERTRSSEVKAARRQIATWQSLAYACREDAERASQRHQAEAGYITLDVIARVCEVHGPFKRGRGRPRKLPEPALESNRHFRITYETVEANAQAIDQRLKKASTFIQIRTRNADWNISDAEMIDTYRDQYLCEHGFSWLKSGAGVKGINPIYLETPKRIASLCFIYLLGLMIWTLIQRTIRGNLKKWNLGLPYHRNKPSAKITTRFLFELFPKVQSISYRLGDQPTQKKVLGLNDITALACKALGCNSNIFEPVMENRG